MNKTKYITHWNIQITGVTRIKKKKQRRRAVVEVIEQKLQTSLILCL
jgi:hypothetical protein